MLNELCTSLAELKKKLDLENSERATVQNGPEYVALGNQIEELMQKQNALLAPLPDSRGEYEALRREVMDAMNKEGVYAVGQVQGKFRETREVNANKVLQAIGGDWDLYLTLSNVTQTALKAFAAENPEIKKELNSCIEVVDRKLVDLAFEAPITL